MRLYHVLEWCVDLVFGKPWISALYTFLSHVVDLSSPAAPS